MTKGLLPRRRIAPVDGDHRPQALIVLLDTARDGLPQLRIRERAVKGGADVENQIGVRLAADEAEIVHPQMRGHRMDTLFHH